MKQHLKETITKITMILTDTTKVFHAYHLRNSHNIIKALSLKIENRTHQNPRKERYVIITISAERVGQQKFLLSQRAHSTLAYNYRTT